MRKKIGKHRLIHIQKRYITENKDILYCITAGTIRTILCAIPGCGLASQIWSEIDNFLAIVAKNKATTFAQALNERFEIHKAEIIHRIKKVELTQDEMSERVAAQERIIDCLAKEYETQKVQLLAQVTVNCIVDDSLTWDKKIRAIDSFHHITMKDIAVLKQFSEKEIMQVKDIACDSLEGLIPSLCKLSSIGLIFEMPYTDGGVWTDSVESEWKRAWPNKYFEILPTGKELLVVISE